MITFGDYSCISGVNPDTVIFNLSSLIEGFNRIQILPNFNMDYTDRNFDIVYAQYLLDNDGVFYELMKICMALYNGLDVFILVSRGGIYDQVTESLQKLLQQRYGLISNDIYELDDWNYVQDCDFSIQGLYNLDIDKERFVYIHVATYGLEE